MQDILKIKENPFSTPFIVYVFGKDNFNCLSDMGFNCSLIQDDPIIYDMEKQMWRHKLDVFKAASEDFDEFVYLDWDCKPTAAFPVNFWEELGKKAPIQANLLLYRTKRCLWRKKEQRKTCNGGFVYIRDKSIPDQIIKNYNEFCEWVAKQRVERSARGLDLRFREKALIFDDEPAISKYTDDYIGGWQGANKYWELFEPYFCNIKKSAFSRELLGTKNECFVHWV
jgi:hypothetical protein